MLVRRVPIAPYAVLVRALRFLQSLPLPAGPYLAQGDWSLDIGAGPPAADRSRPLAYRYKPIDRRHLELAPDAIVSGTMYYPPGGAGLGWHTDSAQPGWRVYLGVPLAGAPGAFHVAGGVYIDEPGMATAFLVSGKPCDSWHALWAPAERAAIGVRIVPGGATARALGL